MNKVMETATQSLGVYQSSFSGTKSSVERISSHTPSPTTIKQQSQLRHMRSVEIGRRKSKKSRVQLTQLPRKTKGKCTFCQLNDCASITSCTRRASYKTNGNEVELTDSNQYRQLRTRIENEMPVAVYSQDIRFLDSIGRQLERQHMVLHEAYFAIASPSFSYMSMNNMCFKVSFIDANGNVPDNSKNMYLSGHCLEFIFGRNAALNSRKRLVYDNTVFAPMNNNWTSRNHSQRREVSYVNDQHHRRGMDPPPSL
mmetsp:Transcript_17831/g.20325  ORF Transcript_17831/g.20325 Transcript_17831/m.20325 type:complete len:255 (-) Transcript_17831:107-871(-)